MRVWLSILAVTGACWTLKALGPLSIGDRPLPPALRGVIALMAPVLLAGLIIVELGGAGWEGLDGAQLAGVGAAGAARLARAPMILAVVVGCAVAAGLRAL